MLWMQYIKSIEGNSFLKFMSYPHEYQRYMFADKRHTLFFYNAQPIIGSITSLKWIISVIYKC